MFHAISESLFLQGSLLHAISKPCSIDLQSKRMRMSAMEDGNLSTEEEAENLRGFSPRMVGTVLEAHRCDGVHESC